MSSSQLHILASVRTLLKACLPPVRLILEKTELCVSATNTRRVRPVASGKLAWFYEPVPSWSLNISAVESLPEFSRLVTFLETAVELKEEFLSGAYSNAGGWGPPTAKAVAINLVHVVLHALEFESVDDAISRALDLLDQSISNEFIMRVVAPLNYLSSEVLPIKLDEQFLIDHLSWADMESYWDMTEYASVFPRTQVEFDAPIALFGKVGLKKFRSPHKGTKEELRRLADLALRVVHLLRLLCPGRLSAPWVHMSSSSSAGDGISSGYILSPKEQGPGRLSLRHGDEDRLKVLWVACHGAPANVLEALRWFGHSRERHREEDRAIDLMTAAEALFLGDAEPELKHRLSLRCAYYVSSSIECRLDVFQHTKTAYDVRSALVHGSSTRLRKLLKNQSLFEFSNKTEDVIRSAIMRALEGGMPTDWDRVLLGTE